MKPMPITYVWREVEVPRVHPQFVGGEIVMAMVPLPRFANYAKRLFGEPGSEHTLEPTSVRSLASHNHYFAALTEAYNNLPEKDAAKYPSLEHFRKRLLVAAGYSEDRHIACKNHDHAVLTSAFIRELDAFAVIGIDGSVVVIRRAKSQDLSHMKKEEFEASKKAVLELASEMVGITPSQLKQNAGRSA